LLGVIVPTFVATALSQTPSPRLDSFLREQIGFTASELRDFDQGKVLVKLPRTAETREVVTFAAMPIDVTADFFTESVRDIVTFSKSEHTLQIGKFSNPPRVEDLASLTFEKSDIDALRFCKPKKCDVKLPVAAMERFRKEINWSLPDGRDRAAELWKQILIEYAGTYLREGNKALFEYNDKSDTVQLNNEFKTLLQPAAFTYEYTPELQKYLEQFPNARPAESEDFVYWIKETFGLKPVVSLTHLTIHRHRRPEGTVVLVASKGIYASHYLESSLGFTAFVDNEAPGPSYLVYVNRSRSDALRGVFAGLKRMLIGGRVRDGARRNMELVRGRLEGDHQ
jgi:hypothetical protein